MKEKAKTVKMTRTPLEPELTEQTESDPESARKIPIAKRVAEKYADALQRLADS
jgi:hypothetical protein